MATAHDSAAAAIQLTILGSGSVQLRAVASALEAGGVQLESVSYEGTALEDRLTLSLTAEQAGRLVEQIRAALGGRRG